MYCTSISALTFPFHSWEPFSISGTTRNMYASGNAGLHNGQNKTPDFILYLTSYVVLKRPSVRRYKKIHLDKSSSFSPFPCCSFLYNLPFPSSSCFASSPTSFFSSFLSIRFFCLLLLLRLVPLFLDFPSSINIYLSIYHIIIVCTIMALQCLETSGDWKPN